MKAYAEQIEGILDTQIIVADYKPSRWIVLIHDKGKMVGATT